MDRTVKQKMAERADRDRWWPSARRLILRELLRRHLPACNNRRILDAGCGPGWNLPLLAEFGQISAVEADEQFVTIARVTEPEATVLHGSIPETQINGEFDLICFLDVIEHLEDDREALRWARSMLAPGGCLCIAVPAFSFLWSHHDIASYHYRRYALSDLESLLGDAFVARHKTYFNFWLFPFAALGAGIRKLMAPTPTDFRSVNKRVKTLKNSKIERMFGRLLHAVFASERHIIPRMRIPFGVSAFILVQEKETSQTAPPAQT